MSTANPKSMKALGRQVRIDGKDPKRFNHDLWIANREDVVFKLNLAKYSQNPKLKKALFDTYPKILGEAAPRDKIWGIGFGIGNPLAQDQS